MMKKLLFSISTLALLLISAFSFAQFPAAPPAGINYQAVARDTAGKPISSSVDLVVVFSIYDLPSYGTLIYQETHTVNTNRYGLFTCIIGKGTPDFGIFDSIQWYNGNKYLEIKMAVVGGSGYYTLKRTQLWSVPYSFHSRTSDLALFNWSLTGNINTSPLINYIGTNDNVGLVVRTNSQPRMIIKADGKVGVGTGIVPPASLFSVGLNSKFQVDSTGAIDTATGINSSGTIRFSGLSPNGVVKSSGSNGTLAIGPVNLSSEVIDTLSIAHGGTGLTSLGNWQAFYSDGSGAFTPFTLGAAGTVFHSNGPASAPSWVTVEKHLFFRNGLTRGGSDTVRLGGILTQNTTITGGNNNTLFDINGQGNFTIDLSGAGNFNVMKGSSTALFVDPITGNVGIGTATPGKNLEVLSQLGGGRIYVKSVDQSSSQYVASNFSGNGGYAVFGVESNIASRTFVGSKPYAAILGTRRNKSIHFATDSIVRVTIDSSGNVGIGTSAPDASALLDISAGNKGVLIPRAALTSTLAGAPITSPTISLLLYNTATAGTSPNNVVPGYYYWDGTKWVSLSGGNGGNDWGLLGNAGTTGGTNFIGTTDNIPLNFRVNNQKAGRIDHLLFNTFWGYNAGNANTTGTYNTANGDSALYSNTTGSENTAIGAHSLIFNTTGDYNTGNGAYALYLNTSGNENTANGDGALYSNTSGYNNTANGVSALYYNTTGFENTANGVNSLTYNTTGSDNTANGMSALYSNNIGNYNTANGHQALFSNESGNDNTANGADALHFNTTGEKNTAIGVGALLGNNIGMENTAIGKSALYSNTSGNYNTATGRSALLENGTGNGNTANGDSALYSNSSGNNNVALGHGAGASALGSGNVFLGYKAGYNETGSDKLYIANGSTNTPLIYGNFSTGNVGIGTNSPTQLLTLGGAGGTRLEIAQISASLPTNTSGTLDPGAFVINQQSAGSTNPAADLYLMRDRKQRIELGNNNTYISSQNNGDVEFLINLNETGSLDAMHILGTNGNVGIGTAAPASLLHVAGQIAIGIPTPSFGMPLPITGSILFYNSANNKTVNIIPGVTSASYTLTLPIAQGAASTVLTNNGSGVLTWGAGASPAWSLTGNINTTASNASIGVAVNNNFIGTTDLKDFVIATNNLERLRVTQTGDVNIQGTGNVATTIYSTGGVANLNVGTNSAVGTDYSGISFRNDFYNPGSRIQLFTNAGGNEFRIFHFPNAPMTFYTNALERLRILGNGNVGIGTATPGAKLQIETSAPSSIDAVFIRTTGSNSKALEVWNTGTAGTSLTNYGAYILTNGASVNVGSTNIGGYFAASGAANNYAGIFMGSVGIGTNAPAAYLDINPLVSTTTDVMSMKSSINYINSSNMTNWYGNYIAAPVYGAGGIITNKYALVTEAGAGNIGIGTTSPSSTLQVNGSTASAVLRITGSSATTITLDATNSIITSTLAGETLILPTAASAPGRIYYIKNLCTSVGQTLTINGPSAASIDGYLATYPLGVTAGVIIVSDGLVWAIVAKN